MLTLLRPAKRKPRPTFIATPDQVVAILTQTRPGDLWALDLETKGVDAADPASTIVGIGLANAEHCFYIDMTQPNDELHQFIRDWLRTVSLVAYNVMFDGTFLQAWTGRWHDWAGCAYALFKQAAGEGHQGQSWNLETAQRDVLGWDTSNKTVLSDALKERGLSKADMWRLPAEILGPYCASDADACWQLWEELNAQLADHPHLLDFHGRVFMTEVRLLAAQQLRGIQVNQEKLYTCHRELIANIDSSMQSFLNHPQVAHHIQGFNDTVRAAWQAAEPPHHTTKGVESARWRAWRDREQRHMDDNGFNPNSKQQLADLFFNKLGYQPRTFTETGRASVDRKVLPSLGEPGRLLNAYNLLVKRRGYVEAVMEKSRRDGCVHPQFNSVGTVTGRLGGSGGLNMQQQPKTPDFLSALSARPGHKLVQADAEALEPTILAEFSRDKTLWSVYGPGAKKNDIYLLVCSKLGDLGREVRKYYDPNNPTPEGIAAAKKFCKRERGIAKTCKLAYDYGAGAPKIQETLVLNGIDISLREVREIRRDLDKIFAGLKGFELQLQEMWHTNGGWIPSALGTPICVAEQYLKDITNRFAQKSGHEILQLWIYHTAAAMDEAGLLLSDVFPWLVDNHDEQVWEAVTAVAQQAADAIDEGLRRTNAELGMDIPIKGPVAIADNLAEIKCENYVDWLNEQSEHDEDVA